MPKGRVDSQQAQHMLLVIEVSHAMTKVVAGDVNACEPVVEI
ncbi:hypothetical protein GMSM_46560 [Geomonas sp. Red276]